MVVKRAWALGLMLLCAACASVASKPDMSADRDQIVALEKQRCDAITRGDIALLQTMLADDYVHVHGTAKIDTKQGFLENIRQRPRRTERGELNVRFYGPIAIMTGEQINYTDNVAASATVTQVLRKLDGHWLYESFQLTFKPAPAAAKP